MPTERPGAVTLGGHPLTLLGPAIQKSSKAKTEDQAIA